MGSDVFQSNFLFGEVDELASQRFDKNFIEGGCRKLRNFRQLQQGGITRRPGSYYLNQLAAGTVRIEPFVFNKGQQYITCFADTQVSFYDLDGLHLHTVTGCPWSAADIKTLDYTGRGDVMFVTHSSFWPATITRTAYDVFELDVFKFEYSTALDVYKQPYARDYSGQIGLKFSARTGSNVTCTSSDSVFEAGHVGEYWRVQSGEGDWREFEITSFTSATSVKVNIRDIKGIYEEHKDSHAYDVGDVIFNAGKYYESQSADITAIIDDATAPTHSAGVETDGDVRWLYLGPEVTYWQHPLYSLARGAPSGIALFAQRLFLGGGGSSPSKVSASKAGNFYDFDAGKALDADSIQTSVDSNFGLPSVRYFVGGDFMQVFADGGAHYFKETITKPLSPETPVRPQGSHGLSDVKPYEFDGASLFVDGSGETIRELLYSGEKYSADPISILSHDLIRQPVDLSVTHGSTGSPEQNAYFCNSDGTLAVYLGLRKHSISGWGLWETKGKYLSTCFVGNASYVAVEREINGETVNYLEKFDTELTLDSALKKTGTSQSFLMAHLEGEQVEIVEPQPSGHLGWNGQYLVSGSNVNTTEDQTDITIGLNYIPVMIPNTPVVSMGNGSKMSAGTTISIAKAIINVQNSHMVEVNGDELLGYYGDEDISEAPQARNGNFEVRTLGWDTEGSIEVIQNVPLPLTIRSLIREVEVSDD